ncbi:hypothetical protein NIASO_14160 [Niabella soli DSM 19437]|uniref:Uncharacterized protein n=1 Tax=Niabella soli DSM 19437 TaxID=929713 RepID=W0F8K1_9BACT|nr:hypothetical protein NIASO_14160 [Niabella soli DSM 19437]
MKTQFILRKISAICGTLEIKSILSKMIYKQVISAAKEIRRSFGGYLNYNYFPCTISHYF